MSEAAQTGKKEGKSKRQQGHQPDPVVLHRSPAKEVKRLLQAYPGLQVQHQQASTSSSLTLPGARRGSLNGSSSYDGSLQTIGGRISPGIQERIQTLEAAASAAAESSGSRSVTPEAPRTESNSAGESDNSDEEFQEPGTPQETGSKSDDDEEDPITMAVAVVQPPMFTGGEKDDPKDSLERFEVAARQNNWNDAAKVAQFGAYMDGMARQWFNNAGNLPNEWEDVAATANAQAREGLRTAFLNEFQSPEYKRALQKKLRTRRQTHRNKRRPAKPMSQNWMMKR